MTSETSAASAYEQTQREHERLREMIKHLHQEFEIRPERPREIARRMQELRAALATHFNNEECAGFFDQIVARAPQLSRQAQRLTHEHLDLLEELDSLARAAEIATSEATLLSELSLRFRTFSKKLMHHESEENGMLQSAYGDDIGTKD